MLQDSKTLISLEATHPYHSISRYVRRAWLGGEFPCTCQSLEDWRHWILDN